MTAAADIVVRAHDLSVQYRARDVRSRALVLDGVSFELARGHTLGVVGEAGAGKSTLARAIALRSGRGSTRRGFPQICGGSLRVFGYEARHMSQYRADRLRLRIGYLPQNGADLLDPRFTVAENVADPIYSRDRRYSSREAGIAVATLIDAVRLPLAVMHLYPHELSSGQRQRVALARALILEPELLITDEPTRGVDVTVRDGVLDVLDELRTEIGFSAIVVSSDLGVASHLSERILVLHRGIVVALGPVDEVLRTSHHPYVRGMARTAPVVQRD